MQKNNYLCPSITISFFCSMKSYITIFLLFASIHFLSAQENRERAEAMAAIATQREAKGGSFKDFNPLFEQALAISPDYAELYILWGVILAKHAEAQGDTLLMRQSFGKFEKAINLKPDIDQRVLFNAYYAWGAGLALLSVKAEDENILPQCFDKFSKAIELNPSAPNVYRQWGELLFFYAQKKKDIPQMEETIEKYDKALAIEPNSLPALLGKGYTYLCMGRYEDNYKKYQPQLESTYVRAEQLGGQSAAYNLACYYSLIKDKDNALKWLEKTIVKQPIYEQKMTVLTKERIDKDEDFDNIRKDKRYRMLLDKYFGK